MMNYIKSEVYRITHTKELYLVTGIMAALVLLFNGAIHFWGGRYAVTSFSYSNLVSNPMVFVAAGTVIAYILYEDSHKNGNLKNTVAGGISRIKIFAGECIISAAVSTLVMAVTLAVWILSAEFLLEHTGPVVLDDLLWEIPMVYLIAIAGLISGIVFMELFEKSVIGIIGWFLIWIAVPKMFVYLALRFEAFYPTAMWMPSNFFGVNGVQVNMQTCITVWDTASGMARCVISGIVGIVVFTAAGILAVRKKDL